MHFQFSRFTNGIFFKTLIETDFGWEETAYWPVEKSDNKLVNDTFHLWFEWNWKWTDPRPRLFCALVANTFLFVFLLFCSWCLFISQRLCVNMSIWIKHIVCIYCLFTCIACKNNHSSFHVYSYHQRFLNCGSGHKMGCRSVSVGYLQDQSISMI